MKFKKLLATGILTLLLAIPTVAFAYSYGYTYNFKYALTSSLFYLDPDPYPNDLVRVENTSSSYGGNRTSSVFYVDVYGDNGFGVGEREGTLVFPRDGSAVQGLYVGNSKYRKYSLKFRKSDDGEYVDGYGRAYD